MAKPGTDGSPRVMYIRFGSGNAGHIEETLETVDGGDVPQPYFERVYRDPESLHHVTRPKNLELLQTLAREEPGSIRATARLVDRDVSQVHRNLEELEALGLVAFEETGRAKRPYVWYDEIDVELPLGDADSDERLEA